MGDSISQTSIWHTNMLNSEAYLRRKMWTKNHPKFVLTQGSCLLSSHLTKHIPPRNAISSLGEKNFRILYLHTSSLSRIEISICSQLMQWWFSLWMSLATSHLGILRVTWVWKLMSVLPILYLTGRAWGSSVLLSF